jgi:pyridoxal biosynthesis lyase PdxS
VDEGDMEWNIVNGQGETPLDMALFQSLNVEDVLVGAGISPEDPQWDAMVQHHFATFEQIRKILESDV